MTRSMSAFGTASLAALVLAGCVRETVPVVPVAAPQQSAPSAPGGPPVPLSVNLRAEPASSPSQIIRGSGSFVGAPPPKRPMLVVQGDGITLNFVNADVSEVAKAVLGDFLKLNYVVDASVQGAITLQTSQPLPRAEVLPALEAAFRLSGLALLKNDAGYRIVPIADAPRAAGVAQLRGSQPGFGIEIVPLRFVGATQMQHMLEPLVPANSILRADTARNLLVISGTAQERQAMLDNIRLFDVDWMAGMSFALFPLHSAEAKNVAAELNDIIGTKDGPLAGIVRLTAIDRMNAVLAISPQPKYLETLQSWIDRLDKAQESSDRRLYVYYVQNGRVADLAGVLSKVLGISTSTAGSAGPSQSSNGQLPPVPESLSSPIGGSGTGGGSFGQSTGQSTGLSASLGSSVGSIPPEATPAYASTADSTETKQTGVRITADQTTNALLILATSHEYALIEQAIRELDVAPLQVMLEAAVVEVTLTDDLNFGVQYALQAGRNNQVIQTTGASATISPSLPGFSYLYSINGNIAATLSALQDLTTVNVLSAPEVLVLNNQTATLQVGDQVPIATQSAVSTTTSDAPVINSIEYRDTGIILKVTPRVNQGGLVMMDVAQEVSDVASTTSSSLNSPTISERKINTTVSVQDGETVALGGLMSTNQTHSKSGVPYLQDIPYLGNLFSTTTNSGTKTELLVLITPRVVQGAAKLRALTDELKQKMPAVLPVLQNR